MSFTDRTIALVATCSLVLGGVGGALAQDEHPEHPEHPEKASKEHPEHPEHPEGGEVTLEALGKAIDAWVAWDSKLHGGQFYVYDKEEDEILALTIDKIHLDKLASLGDGVYFACADFKATNGHMYDLDVFMKAKAGSPFHGLAPTEVAVHKKNGKARYSWREEDGVWSKKK